MKKLLLLTALAVFGFQSVNAQMSFSHAIGAKYLGVTQAARTIEAGEVTIDIEKSTVEAIGIVYSPRLNVLEVGDSSTVSIGSHIGLAFEASSRTGSSFVYDLPIVAEYNFGQASNNDNDDGFGFYLGGGYGIHNSSLLAEALSGPLVSGGLRFVIADRPLDLNVSYLLAGDEINILGLGIQYSLGM